MTKKPQRSRRETVGTVNRSIAAMSSFWLRGKAIRRFTWSGSVVSRGMYPDHAGAERHEENENTEHIGRRAGVSSSLGAISSGGRSLAEVDNGA